MLNLRPYKDCDAQIITSWLTDEESLYQWSADQYNRFPITAEDMNGYYSRFNFADNVWGFTAFDETGIIGHLTMRYPDANRNAIRLGFVIVAPDRRGCGYGKELVNTSIRYIREFLNVDKVTLGVFENNPSARHCYESCGFKRIGEESYIIRDEVWKSIEMELSIKR